MAALLIKLRIKGELFMKKVAVSIFILLLFGSSTLSFAYGSFNFPPGNYQETCHMCTMFNNDLSCICNDKNSFSYNTTIYIPYRCNFIDNINGQLRCTHYHHRYHHRRYLFREFSAGPIWNQNDAEAKCPITCANQHGRWTGQWNTVAVARNSVCQCKMHRWRQSIQATDGEDEDEYSAQGSADF